MLIDVRITDGIQRGQRSLADGIDNKQRQFDIETALMDATTVNATNGWRQSGGEGGGGGGGGRGGGGGGGGGAGGGGIRHENGCQRGANGKGGLSEYR